MKRISPAGLNQFIMLTMKKRGKQTEYRKNTKQRQLIKSKQIKMYIAPLQDFSRMVPLRSVEWNPVIKTISSIVKKKNNIALYQQ